MIETDAELTDFLNNFPNCTELNGDLNLQSNVTTTTGLENIVSISGTLTIRETPIKDLDGLVGLIQIDGSFGIRDVAFTADLANVSLALNKIGGQLLISQNSDLSAINALENLLTVDEVSISSNPVLTELGGLDEVTIASKLTITDNAALSNCAIGGVCDALSLPAADLTISGNKVGCANFFQVEAACTGNDCPQNITVTTNQEIIDITTAYPNCVNLPGNLTVTDDATQLFRFDLKTVGGDAVFQNLGYSDFDQLELISVGGNFEIISLPNLVSTFANGLLPLQSVGGTFRMQNLPSIENVAAFGNVTSIGGFWIIACDQLNTANDFNAWNGTALTGGRIILDSNPNIEDLSLLSPLNFGGVTFDRIQLIGMPLLEDISTLSVAADVNTLIIGNNPNLDDCSIAPVCAAIANPLASLIFQNNATGCNTEAEVKADCYPDLAALIDLYNATNGPNWTDNTGWAEGAAGSNCNPCDGTWFGITCNDNDRVELLSLRNNLTGSIPSSIGQLSQVELLDFVNNNLTGSIPDEIFALPRLERLFFTVNNLTGGIPASIGNAPALRNVVFSSNPNLGGTIPLSITTVSTLETFGAGSCGLTGALPVINDGDLPLLRWIVVPQNELSGSFSANYGFLTNLERIELDGNNFSGLIPSIFSFVPNLRTLHLDNNDFVNGLPTNLNDATSLEELKVNGNNLNGPLRPNLRDLVDLEIFDVSGNGFTGDAPALDQSPNLTIYDVSGNGLDGLVPNALLSSTIMTRIDLSDNGFIGPLPLFPVNSDNTLAELDMSNNDFAGCYPLEYAAVCSVVTDFSGNAGLPDGGSASSFNVDFCNDNDECGALPVNWLGFSARMEGKVANLRWQTAAEENNEGFVVQRSADGLAWEAIGRVAGSGSDYVFTDEFPLPGNSFYRIKQLDMEGNFSFSPVATVWLNEAPAIAFPNPFKDQLTVISKTQDLVEVYDANGRKVQQYVHLGDGAQVQRLVLRSGVYTIRLRSSGRVARIVAR